MDIASLVKARLATGEARQARREVERQAAIAALADALNRLDAAQERVEVALVSALDQEVPEIPLRELLGVSHATFWRRVKAARETVDNQR